MKKLLKNFWFHLAILAACSIIMIVDVVATGSNDLTEMTILGRVAGYIFLADLCGFAFYMIVLKMIFKIK